ncbi:MAG TPA: hypothetical protein VFU37_04535 [Pyrinomonadaceae bacterium]|nr:hypothetical protein [Pyrinomonadaceae bacterium]
MLSPKALLITSVRHLTGTMFFALFLTMLLPYPMAAKRTAPPKVEPVVHDGIRYVAPNDDGRRAYIEAWVIRTNKKLWDLTVFINSVDPKLEEDVQWVFIKALSVEDGTLLVTAERGRRYQVDLETKAIKELEADLAQASQAVAQQDDIPEAVSRAIANGPLAKNYDISFQVNPFYLRADFNGDGKTDTAVLVKQRLSGKIGIAIIHGASDKITILGAGTAISNGGDDFDWMDSWQVYSKGRAAQQAGETSVPPLRGDALLVSKSEAASALIYWTGKRYAWLQQGD